MTRAREFPDNAVPMRTFFRGPHPVAVHEVGSVDRLWARGMDGHTGTIRIGEPSSPSRKFSGDLGPLQNFRGGVFVGKAATIRRGFNTALPNTSPPAAATNPVLDLLGRTR